MRIVSGLIQHENLWILPMLYLLGLEGGKLLNHLPVTRERESLLEMRIAAMKIIQCEKDRARQRLRI